MYKEEITSTLNDLYLEETNYKSVVYFTEYFAVCSKKKYNWLQKKMLKLLFNIEVIDYE